jgi:hypothetical protein
MAIDRTTLTINGAAYSIPMPALIFWLHKSVLTRAGNLTANVEIAHFISEEKPPHYDQLLIHTGSLIFGLD